jgi:predicted negative regulator of RcsB-dependent stress response
METKYRNISIIAGIIIIIVLVIAGLIQSNNAVQNCKDADLKYQQTVDQVMKDSEERTKKLEAEYEKSQKELDELNNQ